MADTAPIELPTGRRSFIAPANINVHDRNWIPVLNEADLKKVQQYQEKDSYASPTLSALPKIVSPSTNSPVTRPALQHNYSKSSLAPESVASELEGDPLPPRTSSKKSPIGQAIASDSTQHLRQGSENAQSSDGQETVTSDGADGPSTAGTNSLLEEQYYTLPEAPVTKDDIQPPALRDFATHSARSSIASTATRSKVPTSKYNRKPVSNIATQMRSPTTRSQPVTPHDSPKLLPSVPLTAPPIPPSEALPPAPPMPAELSQTTPPATPRVYAAKSTASERRARALHSHPSNISLASQNQPLPTARSRANSSSDDQDIIPKPPSVRHKARKSTDSRTATTRGTIYDSQTPTPAPTTPLPQLPPEASSRRPSMKGAESGLGIKHSQSQTQLHQAATPTTPNPAYIQQSRPASPQIPHAQTTQHTRSHSQTSHLTTQTQQTQPYHSIIQQPPAAHLPSTSISSHVEMASFMTSTSTVIFRRFDDVHVKLLLCLQDEISQLERELMRLDGAAAAPAGVDKMVARGKVMRELRRVVGEYGEFAFSRYFGLEKC